MIKKTIVFLVILFIIGWFVGESDWHLDRNKQNKLPVGNLKKTKDDFYKDENGLIWELQPAIKNKFHQPDEESDDVKNPYPNLDVKPKFDIKNPNIKFLSELENGCSYEAILQPNGTYLITGVKQGTYNYAHPDGFWGSFKHFFLDVIPHFYNDEYK